MKRLFLLALFQALLAADGYCRSGASDSLVLTPVARIGGLCQKGMGVHMKCHPYFLGAVFSELVLVDMGNGDQPLGFGRIELGDSITDPAFKDGLADVLVKGSGLSIVDWSHPRSLVLIGVVSGFIRTTLLALSEEGVYFADGDSGVVAVDVKDPTRPASKGAFEPPRPKPVTGMDIEGDALLIAYIFTRKTG